MNVRRYTKRLAPVVMAIALVAGLSTPATAATVTDISVTPSNPTPGATNVTYTVTASGVTATNIQCIRVEFDTQANGAGGVPAGFANGAITGGTWRPAGWAAGGAGAAGVYTATGAAGSPVATTGATIVVTGVTNPSAADTDGFFVRVNTYNNSDCSTSPVDDGLTMTVTTDDTEVTAVVDPIFTFTVADNVAGTCNGVSDSAGTSATGTAVNLGNVNTSALRNASQLFTVGTNAANGYTVFARYDAAMRDTTNPAFTIDDWTGTNASPTVWNTTGDERFGYTSGDATLSDGDRFGANEFAGMTGTNAEVAYAAAGPVDNEASCIGYQIGVDNFTEAGSYTTTVTYTAVPTF